MATGLWLLAAIINLLPVIGVLGGARLQAAYGVELSEPNLQILLRHRALLFGLIGGLMVYAAWALPLRPAAFVLGLLSMVGYLLLCWRIGAVNPQLRRIAWVDVVGVLALLLSAALGAV